MPDGRGKKGKRPSRKQKSKSSSSALPDQYVDRIQTITQRTPAMQITQVTGTMQTTQRTPAMQTSQRTPAMQTTQHTQVDELRAVFRLSKPLFIAATETWLNNNIPDTKVNNNEYCIERN